MASSQTSASTPLVVQRQIDASCQEFEARWKDGSLPRLEDYLQRVSVEWRTELLRELLAIEVCYRKDESGGSPTDSEFCRLHAELMPDMAAELRELRKSPSRGTARDLGRQAGSTPAAMDATQDHVSPQRTPRGLHIRCPHCSNPVELLADTPYESITCRTCGSAFNLVDPEALTMEAPTLKTLGRFELLTRLGVGGFGTVWMARDTELKRSVAIKIPRKGQLAPAEINQFLREAQTVAKLQHANIVPVHEIGREDDVLFIVSDYVRGVSLADWLSGESPSFRQIVELLAIVADALHYAHVEGIVHRDLKPSNILIDHNKKPYLMDFGLAKREVGEITMTVDGQILGTPAYMSPEQARGQGHWVDRRSDIYSLGVILFRMLTGELPFRGNAQMQIHERLTKDAPDPRTLNRFIPSDLATICIKCMEREPGNRFSNAHELAEEFQRFLRGEPIRSRPISTLERTIRWAQRKPALATAAALTLFLAIAGPSIAFVINAQRQRLAALNSENGQMIAQQATTHQNDASRIKELRDSLDIWEGRANPWEFWPPKPAEYPRKMLMERVLAREPTLDTLIAKANDDQQRALDHLAIAIISDELDRKPEAIEHYQAARDLLTHLAAQNPAAIQYPIALADCCAHLSRLRPEAEREAAGKDLERNRSVVNILAKQDDDPRLLAGLFEAEMYNANIPPSGSNSFEYLKRAEKIGNGFEKRVPNDPVAIYELACYLGGREPILETRKKGAATHPGE